MYLLLSFKVALRFSDPDTQLFSEILQLWSLKSFSHSDSPSHHALGRYRHVLFQAVSYVDWKFLIIDLMVEMGVFTALALFLKPLH